MSRGPGPAAPPGGAPEIDLRGDEVVWVTGDVHLAPDDGARGEVFLAFLRAARAGADRLVLLGDLFDYWVGPRHARRCAYRPVVDALAGAAAEGFAIDFVAGNRDFLGPGELAGIGLRVHGDLVVLDREGRRTVVTHGDLLVADDRSYKRYRRWVRSWWFRLGYRLVPTWVRLGVAWLLRGASRRKLGRVEPYAFPVDLPEAERWLARHGAEELLLGHLHRDETHPHPGGGTTRMLPAWGAQEGPYFVVGPAARLERFRPPAEEA